MGRVWGTAELYEMIQQNVHSEPWTSGAQRTTWRQDGLTVCYRTVRCYTSSTHISFIRPVLPSTHISFRPALHLLISPSSVLPSTHISFRPALHLLISPSSVLPSTHISFRPALHLFISPSSDQRYHLFISPSDQRYLLISLQAQHRAAVTKLPSEERQVNR